MPNTHELITKLTYHKNFGDVTYVENTVNSEDEHSERVLIVPGSSHPPEAYEALLQELANLNILATATGLPGQIKNTIHPLLVSLTQQQRVVEHQIVEAAKLGEKIHLVTHSASTVPVVKALVEHPEFAERVKSLQLISTSSVRKFFSETMMPMFIKHPGLYIGGIFTGIIKRHPEIIQRAFYQEGFERTGLERQSQILLRATVRALMESTQPIDTKVFWHPPYSHIVRRALVGTLDQAISPESQRHTAQDMNIDVHNPDLYTEVEAPHNLLISHPVATAAWIAKGIELSRQPRR